jgi:hypothetical protein
MRFDAGLNRTADNAANTAAATTTLKATDTIARTAAESRPNLCWRWPSRLVATAEDRLAGQSRRSAEWRR